MKLPITDEHLLRYLNGELEAAEIATLKSQLADSNELNQRLEELRVIQTYLKQSNQLENPVLILLIQ
jgi:anti-sigma factor RsiW